MAYLQNYPTDFDRYGRNRLSYPSPKTVKIGRVIPELGHSQNERPVHFSFATRYYSAPNSVLIDPEERIALSYWNIP